MSSPITVDELIAEYDRLRTDQPEVPGLTTREWAKGWGVSKDTANRKIRAAIDAGLMEFVGHRKQAKVDGQVMPFPCYAPVKQPVRKKRAGI